VDRLQASPEAICILARIEVGFSPSSGCAAQPCKQGVVPLKGLDATSPGIWVSGVREQTIPSRLNGLHNPSDRRGNDNDSETHRFSNHVGKPVAVAICRYDTRVQEDVGLCVVASHCRFIL
jgi:hypothetical protein